MGTQGPGRKRHPNRERRTAEDHALNQIAREAEARLAAKRAARAEAREIRMKELERQQKEIYQVQKKYYGLDAKWGDIEQWMEDSERYSHRPRRNPQASDDDDLMSVGSRSSLRTNGYEEELLGVSQYKKSSRSSTGSVETSVSSRGPARDEALGGSSTYYSDTSSALNSKHQQSLHNGNRPSLLTCNTLPSRSQRGSVYDEGVPSGSRRYSSSSSRPPSEYSCYLGSGSRASSRASSARASPVSFEPPGVPMFRRGSTSVTVLSVGHMEEVTIPDVEERPDKDFAEKGSRPVSSLSAATLASLGGTSSRRGSGDTSISVDTEASIREIKDSLAEVEEKYKRSMVTNAQLDNEKGSLLYQVDTMRDVLLELEEELAESRRQYEEKRKECERQKHEQSVLRFQLAEMKDALEQREQMMTKHGIAQDSEGTANGDDSSASHVDNLCPVDAPMNEASIGKTEEADVKKEMSMVGQSPLPGSEDRNKADVYSSEKVLLHVEGEGDSKSDRAKKITDTSGEIKAGSGVPEVCIQNDFIMDKQGIVSTIDSKDVSLKDVEMEQKIVEAEVAVLEHNLLVVDGEVTPSQRNVSPVDGEFFQDALDFVQTPSPATDSEGEGNLAVSTRKHVDEDNIGKQESTNQKDPKGGKEELAIKQLVKEDIQNPQTKDWNVGANYITNQTNTEEPNNIQKVSASVPSSNETEEVCKAINADNNGACDRNGKGDKPVIEAGIQSASQANPEYHNVVLNVPLSGGDVLDGKQPEQCEESLDREIKTLDQNASDVGLDQKSMQAKCPEGNTALDKNEGDNVIDAPKSDQSGGERRLVEEGVCYGNKAAKQNDEIKVGQDQDDGRKAEQNVSEALCTGLEIKIDDCIQKREDYEEHGHEEVQEDGDSEEEKSGQSLEFNESSNDPAVSSEGETEHNEDEDDSDDKDIEPSEESPREGDKPRLLVGSSVDRTSSSDDTEDKGTKWGKGKNKEDCVIS